MRKAIIFGNSGSGKSTLALQIAAAETLAHLDLDVLAWLPSTPPVRTAQRDSSAKTEKFIANNNGWIIEGCYTDLLEVAAREASEIIFMNLSVELCVANAKARPWESHKYVSKQMQDDNLPMLIDWIRQYATREDVFSLRAHSEFYNRFNGKKTMITANAGAARSPHTISAD